jgi:hypothetical protein
MEKKKKFAADFRGHTGLRTLTDSEEGKNRQCFEGYDLCSGRMGAIWWSCFEQG